MLEENDIVQHEDYSEALDSTKHWKSCSNLMVISEDSLNRTLKAIGNSSFAILTAYLARFTKEENIKRNRKLRAILNSNKMGVHQLVGHFIERQDDGSAIDTVERSYLVEKSDDMTDKEFCSLVIKCLTDDGATQNSALVKFNSKPNSFWLLDANAQLQKIGTKLTLGKIGDAYSQHVKKMSVPFVFEGEEVPETNFGKLGYAKAGYCWSGRNGFGFVK